ncbi:preprotein translocase subunit SecG [Candidatus Woesebacteria bacterium]|nr:preprotein translocase subunit SecG [Candidatus Woesebacteria bacterium]
MKSAILALQIVISALLVGSILVQTKGTGFGRVWGASGVSFARRGLEKLVFKATFVLAALFVILALVQILI